MLISSVFSPSDCTPQALADFEKLVIEGGAVDPQGLAQRIRRAFCLLFLRTSNGELIGAGALKYPRPAYRDRIFAAARPPGQRDDNRLHWGGYVVPKRRKYS